MTYPHKNINGQITVTVRIIYNVSKVTYGTDRRTAE